MKPSTNRHLADGAPLLLGLVLACGAPPGASDATPGMTLEAGAVNDAARSAVQDAGGTLLDSATTPPLQDGGRPQSVDAAPSDPSDTGVEARDTGAPETGTTTAPVPYSGGAQGPGTTDSSGNPWKLIFDDEFNGTSLDASKWAPGWYASDPATSITDPVNVTEACYNPANVSVSGGYLHLALTSGACKSESGKTYSYSTGNITTAPSGGGSGVLFDFLHGYMEARISLPGSGSIDNWPAFWSTGITTGTPNYWPATGEIDVLEGLGGGAYGHWHGPTPGAPSTDDSFGVGPSSPDSFTGWHVFAAEWTSSTITWFYDGLKIGSGTPAEATTTPIYLLLVNQANSSGSVSPGTMLVDYVRVWQ